MVMVVWCCCWVGLGWVGLDGVGLGWVGLDRIGFGGFGGLGVWVFGFGFGLEEIVLANGPDFSIGGAAQCLLIGNVTWEVVLDEGIEEEDVSVKGVE